MGCEHEFENQGHHEDGAGVTYIDNCMKCNQSRTQYVENYFPTREELDEELEREIREHRIKEREARRDVRTYCKKCAMDMYHAGIKMEYRGGKRSTCDKCSRQGSDWLVK